MKGLRMAPIYSFQSGAQSKSVCIRLFTLPTKVCWTNPDKNYVQNFD